MQTKDRITNHLDRVKLSADSGPHHRSCIIDVDALAYSKWTTSPASVDEIDAYLVLFNAFTQQVSILPRSQRQEGCAETRTESCLWRRLHPLRFPASLLV